MKKLLAVALSLLFTISLLADNGGVPIKGGVLQSDLNLNGHTATNGQLVRQIISTDGSVIINQINGIADLSATNSPGTNGGGNSTWILPLASTFGAIGNGVTDDTAALQAGLNSGGVALQSGKTYLVSGLTLANDAQIRGAGKGSILKLSTSGTLIDTGSKQLDIEGVTLLGGNNGTLNSGQTGIKLWAGGTPSVRNVWIRGFNGSAIAVAGDNNIFLRSNRWSVINMNSESNYAGITMSGSSTAEYGRLESSFIGNCVVGIDLADGNVNISGNTVIDCSTNLYIHPNDNRSHSLVSGNLFNHSTNAMLFALNCGTGFSFVGNHAMATDGGSNSIFIINSTDVSLANNYFELSGLLECSNSSVIIQNNHWRNTGAIYPSHTTLCWAGGNYEDGVTGTIDSLLAPNLISLAAVNPLVAGQPTVGATGGLIFTNSIYMQGALYPFPNFGSAGESQTLSYWQTKWPGTHNAWEQGPDPIASGGAMRWQNFPEGGSGFTSLMTLSTNGDLAIVRNLTVSGLGLGVAHSSSGGLFSSSPVVEADQSLSDVTTDNVSTSKHGYAPKADGNAAHYLDGFGNWTTPAGGGGGAQTPWASDINGNSFSLLGANQVSASGFTNLAATPNTIANYDANKKLGSMANGGANTFLQGTTPPTWTAISAAALPPLLSAYPQALTNNDNRTGGAVLQEQLTVTNSGSGWFVQATGTNITFAFYATNSAGVLVTNYFTSNPGGTGSSGYNLELQNTNGWDTLQIYQDGRIRFGTNQLAQIWTNGVAVFAGITNTSLTVAGIVTNDLNGKLGTSISIPPSWVGSSVFFVATNGASGNNGQEAFPIDLATAMSKPQGSKFILKPGTYTNILVASDNTYWLSQYKWAAKIRGASGFHGISGNTGVTNVTIDGFDVGFSWIDNIKANGDGWVIRNCWSHNAGQGDPSWVTNTAGTFTGQGVAIHGYKNWTIESSLIESNGAWLAHDHGIYVNGTNGVIRYDVIRLNLAYGLQDFAGGGQSSDRIYIYGNDVYLNDTGASSGTYPNANGQRCIISTIDNGVGTNYIWNNTFIATNDYAAVSAGGTNNWTNNVIWGKFSGISVTAGTVNSDYNAYPSSPTPSESHSLVFSNPGLVSTNNGNLWPVSTSPLIGAAFSSIYLPLDYFGHAHFRATAIGAHPYNAAMANDAGAVRLPSPATGSDYWQDSIGYGSLVTTNFVGQILSGSVTNAAGSRVIYLVDLNAATNITALLALMAGQSPSVNMVNMTNFAQPLLTFASDSNAIVLNSGQYRYTAARAVGVTNIILPDTSHQWYATMTVTNPLGTTITNYCLVSGLSPEGYNATNAAAVIGFNAFVVPIGKSVDVTYKFDGYESNYSIAYKK